jgi:D-beta-D-heptose 7-phosphate kinase/D-beta-D-heptose 1-phosphate adenosyltransferase
MKIGFTNGCFDLFHEGHRHYLRTCREQCDYLIVAVNSDRYCADAKGAGRPIWTWETRMEYVRAVASAVIPFEGRWEKLVLEMRPRVVFQGEEYRPKDALDARLAYRRIGWKTEGHGFDVIPIVYIPRLTGYSTSAEIERLGLQKEPLELKTAPP